MKFIIAALMAVSVSGIILKVRKDDCGADCADGWINVPPQKIEGWGHEVERTGHDDWLDEGIKQWKEIRATIPPAPDGKPIRAIWDS